MANRIIVFTGPHEGVGKTTLAINCAVRYATLRKQPVILIDTDPLARGELAQAAGTTSAGFINAFLDELTSRQLNLAALKNRIPLNRYGVGSLSVAPAGRQGETLSSEQWGFLLQTLSQIADVIVDVELFSTLKNTSMEVADMIVWTIAPTAPAVRTSMAYFDSIHQAKSALPKIHIALNQVGLPGSMDPATVQGAFVRYGRPIQVQMPFEPELARLANMGRPPIIDLPRHPYVHALTPLMEKFSQLKGGTATTVVLGQNNNENTSGPTTARGNVIDSMVNEKRKRWNTMKQDIHRDLVEELNIRRIDLNTKGDPAMERQLRTHVESTVNALISKLKETLVQNEREKLVKELVDETLGLGPLEELLGDATITEIMVNRFDQVYIERRGKITLSNAKFIDNNHVVQVIRRIISPLGRRIDESVPMVDARLKDGSRVNAIIPPLAVQGPTLTIRRFPEKAFVSDDLVRMGAIMPGMIDFLKICVALKKNIVIAGGTGTGKTTILNMLSSFISSDERIVTVEDTAELRLQQEHVVRLEARSANIEGQGQVSIRDLVKNCLRMRPDRIVVGECRGGEALDMLQAMNTGHDGSLTTIHANSPRDAFTRLETLCLMAGMDLPVWALREQIRSAVHILVQLTRMQDGSRKVTCITEVTGRNDDQILTQDLFRFVQDSVDDQGHVVGHHEATGELPTFMADLKAKGLLMNESLFRKKAS